MIKFNDVFLSLIDKLKREEPTRLDALRGILANVEGPQLKPPRVIYPSANRKTLAPRSWAARMAWKLRHRR